MSWGRQARSQVPLGEPPNVGEQVIIVAGRHAGAHGLLVAVETVPTPSGLGVLIATVRRPRAGDTFTFITEVRKA